MVKICELLWVIWFKRNQWVFHNKKFQQVQETLSKASSIQLPSESVLHRPGFKPKSWIHLPKGFIKANFDASPKQNQATGLGVLFRDQSGEILAAASLLLPHCHDPLTVETIAFRWEIDNFGFLLCHLRI